ncbi:MAG: heparinase II/III family protein [Candidatus Paracaedibacteraceae bacterium]|nr:heparinase II/III family protein [Candidatus Paracaedibacteraceae bacterium]
MLYSLKKIFWQNLRRSHVYGVTLLGRKIPQIVSILSDPWHGNIQFAEAILLGDLHLDNYRFTTKHLLNALDKPNDAYEPVASYMQSFMFLYDLNSVSGNSGRKRARQLIEHWIRSHHSWAHKSWNSPAWKPVYVGLRLSAWLNLYDFYASTADDDFKRLLVTSFDKQLRYLRRHWAEEKDDLHKFWALKGVILGEALRPGKEKDKRVSSSIQALIKLIEKQILPDGGHISRSPLLHWRFLRDLIDIRTSLRLLNRDADHTLGLLEQTLQNYIQKMTPILRLLRHGDGALALFAGSLTLLAKGLCFGVTPDAVDTVLTLTDTESTRPPQRAPESGYERCASRNSIVLINTFPNPIFNTAVSPDSVPYEPGAEILNLEWSVGQNRIIHKGDILIQNMPSEEDEKKKGSSWITNLNPECTQIIIKRHNKEGSHYISFDLTYVSSEHSFSWHRQIYLTPGGDELKGHDTIRVSNNAIIGIRFELNPEFSIEGEGEKIYISSKSSLYSPEKGHKNTHNQIDAHTHEKPRARKFAEPVKWFFRNVGSDDVLTTSSEEDNRTILLVKQCDENRSHTFKWSFSQTNVLKEI